MLTATSLEFQLRLPIMIVSIIVRPWVKGNAWDVAVTINFTCTSPTILLSRREGIPLRRSTGADQQEVWHEGKKESIYQGVRETHQRAWRGKKDNFSLCQPLRRISYTKCYDSLQRFLQWLPWHADQGWRRQGEREIRNDKRITQLKKDKETHEQNKQIIMNTIRSSSDKMKQFISIEQIYEMREELCSLKHNGKTLREALGNN